MFLSQNIIPVYVKCRTAIKVLFLCFSVIMLDNLSCSFTSAGLTTLAKNWKTLKFPLREHEGKVKVDFQEL